MSLPSIKQMILTNRTFIVMFCFLAAFVLLPASVRAQNFLVEYGLPKSGTNDPLPPKFRVTANKNKKVYDTVEETYKGLSYKVRAKGRCPDKHHLNDQSTISLGGSGNSSGRVLFPVNENNRSIGGNSGQDWNYYIFDFPYLLPNKSPVEACNAELKRKQDAGASLAALLQNGFTLFVANAYDVDLDIACEKNVHLGFYEASHYYAHAVLPAEVMCMPTGYVPTQGAPAKPGQRYDPPPQRTPPPAPPLASVTVAANPAETKGKACPVYVNFSGRITANPDSTYSIFNTKFRFLGENDYKTDWLFVSINRDEPKTVNGRRFIQAPANDSGDTILTPGVKPRIPIYRGWMMLEVQLPNGSKRSERANFSVDCNPVSTKPRIKASN
jgi:hypothetical protein